LRPCNPSSRACPPPESAILGPLSPAGRLVIDIPGKKYSAYVSYGGMPEVPMGIDMAFRDSAGAVNMMNYWGVEAIAGHTTRVCNFAVAP